MVRSGIWSRARRSGAGYRAGHGDPEPNIEPGRAIWSRAGRSGAGHGDMEPDAERSAGSGFPWGDFQKRPASREGRGRSTWTEGAGLIQATPSPLIQCRLWFCPGHALQLRPRPPSAALGTPRFYSGHAPTLLRPRPSALATPSVPPRPRPHPRPRLLLWPRPQRWPRLQLRPGHAHNEGHAYFLATPPSLATPPGRKAPLR